jgi:hypothetical protein
MVKGRAAIEALWKSIAAQVNDPKLTTLDVKPLGPSAAREIGTFSLTKGSTPQEYALEYRSSCLHRSREIYRNQISRCGCRRSTSFASSPRRAP